MHSIHASAPSSSALRLSSSATPPEGEGAAPRDGSSGYAAMTPVQRARLARLDDRDRVPAGERTTTGPAADAAAPAPATDAPAASPAARADRTYGVVAADRLRKLYDLVVIGGGPAGIAGAIKAAQMGRRALVIDKPKFAAGVLPNGLDLFFGGPTGLFSKALRDAAKNTNVASMTSQGMDRDVVWRQIQNQVTKLAARNAEGECRQLARYGIDYLQGAARLLGEDAPANVAALATFAPELDDPERDGVRTVDVAGVGPVTGTKVLVCTGSKSTRLPGIPFEHSHRIFDSDTINLLDFLPRSVTIAGLGIIGIEFANIFNALGVEDVTIVIRGDVEASTKKLGMDMDVANELVRILKQSGVTIVEGMAGFEVRAARGPAGREGRPYAARPGLSLLPPLVL